MAELSSCKSDYVTPKAENIYYFALYRKKKCADLCTILSEHTKRLTNVGMHWTWKQIYLSSDALLILQL